MLRLTAFVQGDEGLTTTVSFLKKSFLKKARGARRARSLRIEKPTLKKGDA
jgi:hypothetical protein